MRHVGREAWQGLVSEHFEGCLVEGFGAGAALDGDVENGAVAGDGEGEADGALLAALARLVRIAAVGCEPGGEGAAPAWVNGWG